MFEFLWKLPWVQSEPEGSLPGGDGNDGKVRGEELVERAVRRALQSVMPLGGAKCHSRTRRRVRVK